MRKVVEREVAEVRKIFRTVISCDRCEDAAAQGEEQAHRVMQREPMIGGWAEVFFLPEGAESGAACLGTNILHLCPPCGAAVVKEIKEHKR